MTQASTRPGCRCHSKCGDTGLSGWWQPSWAGSCSQVYISSTNAPPSNSNGRDAAGTVTGFTFSRCAPLKIYYVFNVGARYYNPKPARFMSRDPWIGENFLPSTLHKYLYASSDPVNRIDPRGEEELFSYAIRGNAAMPEARLLGHFVARLPTSELPVTRTEHSDEEPEFLPVRPCLCPLQARSRDRFRRAMD